VFTTLAHLMDVEFLREAFYQLRRDAAPGLDGVTVQSYEAHLDENLRDLHERLRTGQYQAQPVRRVWLDKADGSQRPIGIPGLEDKIVQRAVVMLLEAVYEPVFYDFSHGFRRGHSAHQALQELREQCRGQSIQWIVDADVSGCFDSIEHGKLQEVIKQRVNDGGLLRLIGKWLHAGVLEGCEVSYPEQGTPQGGVISPMLANIYLHHVLDEWFVQEIYPRLKGRAFLIRYADDFIIACEREDDARRTLRVAVLSKRFARYGLTIHPTKTRLVAFQPPKEGAEPPEEPRTFDFLGFTHYWGRSRRGQWVIKRQTARTRLRRALKAAWDWCRQHRHLPLREQYQTLCQKLRGHYQYYGVRCNYRMLERVYQQVERAWRFWLGRRSRQGRFSEPQWAKLRRAYPLPQPRIIHGF